MAEATIKRSLKSAVVDRVKTGKCLHCEDAATKRGLCDRHYIQYRRAFHQQPTKERMDWEVTQVSDGKILPVGFVVRMKSTNVFADAS